MSEVVNRSENRTDGGKPPMGHVDFGTCARCTRPATHTHRPHVVKWSGMQQVVVYGMPIQLCDEH